MRALAFVLAACSLGISGQAIKFQLREGDPPRKMTTVELAALADPLFRLVLKTKPQEVRIEEVVRLLKGPTGQEHFFVVDEKIADPATGQSRRGVIGFDGSNKGVFLKPNVMLSVIFDANTPQANFIEGWGWDDAAGRYNYYRMDSFGGPLSWKFRGSSVDADKLTLVERKDTCLACHLNGAPVMRELPFPWNNWNSSRSQAEYLTPGGAGHWPIAQGPLLAQLSNAEDLEIDFILPSIRQFNARRIENLIRKKSNGTQLAFTGGKREITDGPRALRSLFETTEYNAASSETFSGLHPFARTPSGLPPGDIPVPATFFLTADLLAGGGFPQYLGLSIPQAREFKSVLTLKPAEYRKLVDDAQLKLNGVPGDSHFAWFGPEASHSDNHMIDSLIREGVVTPQFAAAVLAVDVENPVFSTKTPGLLRFIPQTFRFKPLKAGGVPAPHPDELTTAVVAAIQAAAPAAGTPEAEFLKLLKGADPVKTLRKIVQDYLAREKDALAETNPIARQAELKRLFDVLLARRREAITRPVFKRLNEFEGLFFALP